MKQFYITFLLALPLLLFSQGENDNWYFGNKSAVNFSGASPLVLTDSVMDQLEAVGSVSDSNGKLLFYTDGQTVWTRDHTVMFNGTGLYGNSSSVQLTITKHPGIPNQYYIFTSSLAISSGANSYAYTIVDMSLGANGLDGNPLGEVTNKNLRILDDTGQLIQNGEAITSLSGDGNYNWILIPYNNKLLSYKFDTSGFHNSQPVVSNLNFNSPVSIPPGVIGVKASSLLSSKYKFSNYVCVSLSWPAMKTMVYSFNNSTGSITGDYLLEIDSNGSYVPEFNKDSSVLYLAFYKLYAIDLSSMTSVNYLQIHDFNFAPGEATGAIQRNVKNDIYLSMPEKNYLSKIINPDSFGISTYLDVNNIYLGNNHKARWGLPQTVPNGDVPSKCLNNIVLDTHESNVNYTHQAINTITTQTDYLINGSNGNIDLKAGKGISMLPNTTIEYGSSVTAKIENCTSVSRMSSNKNGENVKLYLQLPKENNNTLAKISIYPNPVKEIVNIKTNVPVLEAEVYDYSGRKMVTSLMNNQINVKHLTSGNYIVKIKTSNGISTEKFIKE